MSNDLLELTAQLVAVPSVSHHEVALADLVEARLRAVAGLDVTRVGDNVVARTAWGRPTRVVLAGHLDTVPPNGNEVARRDGDVLWGLGSTDMKGGLAVMLDLAESLTSAAHDLSYVFYVAEEVAREHSGLLQMEARQPRLLEADAAVVCEPTNCAVEAGCQGVLKARVVLVGERAHVSRPWRGVNAVHRMAPALEALRSWPAREASVEGCTYRESLQVVSVSGGVASNVVPDRAEMVVNYRYAPDRSADAALGHLQDLLRPHLGAGDTVEVVDSAPAAPPALAHPVLAGLVERSQAPVVAKLGWTDVAFFAERGVPAANFGPGDPELAHTAGEHVSREALERARDVLTQVVRGAN